MAKCSQKIICLFQWLRERKAENGLTRKRSKKEEEEDEQRKIYRAMNVLKILIIGLMLSSCGSRQTAIDDIYNKMQVKAKRQSDSTTERLDFIIKAVAAGSTEEKANKLYDSLYVENINFVFPFSTGGK